MAARLIEGRRKRGKVLVLDEYKYQKKKDTAHAFNWRCWRYPACTASVRTNQFDLQAAQPNIHVRAQVGVHTHPSDENEIAWSEITQRLREKVSTTPGPPPKKMAIGGGNRVGDGDRLTGDNDNEDDNNENNGNDNNDDDGGGGDGPVDKLTCTICLQRYRQPKMLPCFHTFCAQCLQDVTGSRPSLLCPSCRSPTLLPQGGVSALQTNIYIERDLDSLESAPQQLRLCDVCKEEREATHTCIQCQQRFCLPCRHCHDGFRLNRAHCVIPLTAEGEGGKRGAAAGDKAEDERQAEMCANHPDQRLVLHCVGCGVDICLHCKLAQHEGHPTEDRDDRRDRARSRLQGVLAQVTRSREQNATLMRALAERRAAVRRQGQEREGELQGRADLLLQRVRQILREAVSRVQEAARELQASVGEEERRLRDRDRALQAQQEHLGRALSSSDRGEDLVSLEAQVSAASAGVQEGDVLLQHLVSRHLGALAPELRLTHSPAAVNMLQLRDFIGVLQPPQPIPSALQPTPSALQPTPSALQPTPSALQPTPSALQPTPSALQPASSSLQTQAVTDCTGPAGHSPVLKSAAVVGRKKAPPREFVYSRNTESQVFAMCPISQNRLWVMYCPSEQAFAMMKLFGADGQVLVTVENIECCSGLVAISHDTVLAWTGYSSDVQLIDPDGEVTNHKVPFTVCSLFPRASSDKLYLDNENENKISEVKFSNKEKLTCSEVSVLSTMSQWNGFLRHLSSEGKYILITGVEGNCIVRALTKDARGGWGHYSSFTPPAKCTVTDVQFCQVDGQELLLVAVEGDDNGNKDNSDSSNKVHLVNHKDGGLLVRYLDTGTVRLNRPQQLATDSDHHVWIGCRGGKVVMVDL